MKKQIKVLLLSVTLAVFALPVVAQVSESAANPESTANTPEAQENVKPLNQFDKYLSENPDVRKDLVKNPSLLTDATYLSHHPGLQKFESEHPGFTKAAKEDPTRAVHRADKQFHRENRARRNAKHNPNPRVPAAK